MAKPAAPAKERPSLTLRRHYPVAAEKVWRAWTDPQALKAWFGPEEIVSVPLAEVDLRVGGRFRVTMLAADGETHDVSGVYQELVPKTGFQLGLAQHAGARVARHGADRARGQWLRTGSDA